MNPVRNRQTLIFSLGGSLIVPDRIDIKFLKRFRKFILGLLKSGHRVVIITGGGKTSRRYNSAAQKIIRVKDADLDWLGIAATKLNAELLRVIFAKHAYLRVIDNPLTYQFTRLPAYKLIIASGWKPGSSSDRVAVLWAKNLKARMVLNLTDVDFVYDKDPDKFPQSKPIKQISWSDFRKIVGHKWSPRASWPFDPIASRLAQKFKLKVIIANGRKLKNLENYLGGKKFKGTVIE